MTDENFKITILFEPNLLKEAKIASSIIKKIYKTDSILRKGFAKKLFKFKKILGGYEIQKSEDFKNYVILTKKDIFLNGAKSKEDDWIFGIATKQKNFIISTNRLHINNQKQYKKRLEHIVIHELGHIIIRNQKHYHNYISVNSQTGYRVNLGKHCLNQKCIMSEVDDIKDLDKHIKINFKQKFCKLCKINLRI